MKAIKKVAKGIVLTFLILMVSLMGLVTVTDFLLRLDFPDYRPTPVEDLHRGARDLMMQNYNATGGKYICPNPRKYTEQWLWDSCFHAEICAELSRYYDDLQLMQMSQGEITRLLEYQRKDGFIPHMIFEDGGVSDLTQPPVLAQALKTINDTQFTEEVFLEVLEFYLYFPEYRDTDGDGLFSIHSPYESGRDTSPEFDYLKGWASGTPLEVFNLPLRFRTIGVEDVTFNSLWVKNVRILAELAPDNQTRVMLRELADRTAGAIYELMWDEDDGIFYAIDSNNQKIRIMTISGLYPLILEDIPQQMLDALVKHLTNPAEFWTEYPIPSVPKNSLYYDVGWQYYKSCNWRGPTWIVTNRHITEGLILHEYTEEAQHIIEQTVKMIKREGFWEYYHPETGQGMRVNLGWSAQIILLID